MVDQCIIFNSIKNIRIYRRNIKVNKLESCYLEAYEYIKLKPVVTILDTFKFNWYHFNYDFIIAIRQHEEN